MTDDWDSISTLTPPAPAKNAAPDWDSISKPVTTTTEAKPEPTTATDYLRAGESGLTFGGGSNINAAARYLAGNKTAAGSGTYDDLLAEERARLHNVHKQDPLGAGAAELAGGLVLPGGLALRGAAKAAALAAPAATLGEAVYGGAKTGAAYGAASGFGNTESDKDTLVGQVGDRIGGAIEGGLAGSAVGSALPLASRAIGAVASGVRESAEPLLALRAGGPDAVADRAIARAAQRSRLSANDIAARFDESDPLMGADLHPAFKQLAGAATRSSPEAEMEAKKALFVRQTGNPLDGDADSIGKGKISGLHARPDFTPQTDPDRPAGQIERLRQQLSDTLDIGSSEQNAYKANKELRVESKKKSDKMFDELRKDGEGVDIRPDILPVLADWRNIALDEPMAVASQIRTALRQFSTPRNTQAVATSTADGLDGEAASVLKGWGVVRDGVAQAARVKKALSSLPKDEPGEVSQGVVSDIDGFIKAKKYLDGRIETLFKSSAGRNKYLAGRLSDFRDDMLGAVDKIETNDLGEKYQAARNVFSYNKRMQDALQAGKDALKNGPDEALDQYSALKHSGEERMFRLGLYSEITKAPAGRTSDALRTLEKPDVRAIIGTITPKDRYDELAQFLSREHNMANTAVETLGNSKTASRQAADATFATDTAAHWLEQLHQLPGKLSIKDQLWKKAGSVIQSVFGYREDVAAKLGQRLFTADPAERAQIIRIVREHATPQQFSQFNRTLNDVAYKAQYFIQARAAQSAGAAVASPNNKDQ